MEIVPGVHWIEGVKMSRAYLIESETLALVDSGFPWSPRVVYRYIESIARRPEELSLILMTHSHPDHASGALAIQKRTGAQIVAHPHDTRSHGEGQASLSYMGVFSNLSLPLPFFERTPVSHLVLDGDKLPFEDDIEVIHTPGHTAGSVCFFLKSKQLMFTGDTLFSDGRRVSRSVPFPGYDGDAYKNSLNRLASMNFEALCGGHGVPLLRGASDRLRELLETKPNPPRWGDFLKSMPRRVFRRRPLTGEHG